MSACSHVVMSVVIAAGVHGPPPVGGAGFSTHALPFHTFTGLVTHADPVHTLTGFPVEAKN